MLTCYRTKLERLLFPVVTDLQLMRFQKLLVLVAWRTEFREHSSPTFQLMFVSFVYGPTEIKLISIIKKAHIFQIYFHVFTCWLCLSPPVWGNWPWALSASSSHLDSNGFNLHMFLNDSLKFDIKIYIIDSIIGKWVNSWKASQHRLTARAFGKDFKH